MSVGSGASFTKALLRSGKKNCMRIVVDSLSFPKTPPGLARMENAEHALS